MERFASSPIGDLAAISGTDALGRSFHTSAFVAHPLAGCPELAASTWNAISRANRALGRIQQTGLGVDPTLLRAPTVRREAQSTSALEGTYAPLEDVLAGELVEPADRSAQLREVLNYVAAANDGFAWVEQRRPLTVGVLTDLHRALVRGTVADTDQAGRIRTIQVVIGSRGGDVESARFIPSPPGTALEAGVRDLLDWMQNPPEALDPVLAAGLAHYQFETLHPFNDGNGRIGRLLIVLQLVGSGVLDEGLLSVSPWFERRREQYQELLAEVSATGSWDRWLTFFATAIEASALDTADRLQRLVDLRGEFRTTLAAAGARGIIVDIAERLIGAPFVSVPMLRDVTGRTYQAVSTAVHRLVELGILEPRPTPGLMTYRATDVVRILTEPPNS